MDIPAGGRWTITEKAVLDRFVHLHSQGDFESTVLAVARCHAELMRVRTPETPERSRTSVMYRMKLRAKELGLTIPPIFWTGKDASVVGQCARGYLLGEYDSMDAAVLDCRERLSRAREGVPRSDGLVRRHLEEHVQGLGAGGGFAPWTTEERRVIERFARGRLTGMYATAAEAALGCSEALVRLRDRHPERFSYVRERTLGAVEQRLWAALRRLRPTRQWMPWESWETEAVNRIALWYQEGVFESYSDAVTVCTDKLSERRRRRRKRSGAAGVRGRSSVRSKLLETLRSMGHPPESRALQITAQERRYIRAFYDSYMASHTEREPLSTRDAAHLLRSRLEAQGVVRPVAVCARMLGQERRRRETLAIKAMERRHQEQDEWRRLRAR